MRSCLPTTDLCPELKIQYSFMELQILWLIQSPSVFHLLSPLVIHVVEKQSPSFLLSLSLSYIRSSSYPSFLCSRTDSRMKEMSKRKERTTVWKMTGRCQNNSPAVIFEQRSFNMVTAMRIQYSWDRSQELLRWVSCARCWLTGL